MKIWVAVYCTESSDRGVVGYWLDKPTNARVKAFFKNIMPDEFEDGNCYVSWDVVMLLPTDV